MSAPTALEAGALRRGIAVWAARANRRGRKGPDRDRRSGAPLHVLSRRHDDLCRHACDPFEIAAVLEAEGLDDRRARAEFRAASVFELGEQLYALVPNRQSAWPQGPNRWHLPLWRAQLRGLLYAVPAVTVALLPAQTMSPAGIVTLLVGTALAIAMAQALSVLGHLLIGSGQRVAFAGLTRCALTVATVAGALATGVCLAASAVAQAGLVATLGVQLVFVVGATVLLVEGRERLLAAVVLPGTVAVLLTLTVHLPAALNRTAAAHLALLPAVGGGTVLATAVTAVLVAGRTPSLTAGPVALREALGPAQWQHALTAAAYGVGLAALASFAVVSALTGGITPSGLDLVVVALPMTATVGTSEYLLHRARGQAAQTLASSRALDGFARRTQGQLRAMVGLHAVVVAAVATVVLALLHRSHITATLDAFVVGYAVLAVALLLTATLLSLGYHRLASRLVATAGGTVVAFVVLPALVGGGRAGVVPAPVLSAAGSLLAVVVFGVVAYRLAAPRFSAVTAHR